MWISPSDHVPEALAVCVVHPPCAHAVVDCILGDPLQGKQINAHKGKSSECTREEC